MSQIKTYTRTYDDDLPQEQYEEALAELRAGRAVEFMDIMGGTHVTHARLTPVSKGKLRVEAWTVWPPLKKFKGDIQDVIEIMGRYADYDDDLFRRALPDNKHGGHGVALYSLARMPRTVNGLLNVLNGSEATYEIEPANTAGFVELVQRLSRGREGGPGSSNWDPFGLKAGDTAQDPDDA